MEKVAKIFKALSDETRLKVLLLVSKRDICQKGISKYLGITDSSVSQHIKVLKEALEVEKLTKLQVASVKLQLGILYYKIKDYEEAVKYFNDIESYLKKEDYGYSKNLNAIILAYINVGQKEKARKVYQEFLKREDEDFTFSRVRALEKYIN